MATEGSLPGLWSGLPEHLVEDVLKELSGGAPNDEAALSVRAKFEHAFRVNGQD